MKLDAASVRALEKVVTDEVAACEEYLRLVNDEQNLLIKFDHDGVSTTARLREKIAERMATLRDKRVDLVSMIAGDRSTSLTQLIEHGCNPADKKKLLALVHKLRTKVDQVEQKSREFAQVVDFSLGLVNGSISILWSATQNVTRCYNAFGGMTQAFQPTPPREGSLLGKA